MDGREFAEWQAFDLVSPLGAWRDDWRTAYLAMMIHNANCGRGKGKKVSDFLPDWIKPHTDEVTEPQSVEAMIAVARALNAAMGGKEVLRGDNRKLGS